MAETKQAHISMIFDADELRFLMVMTHFAKNKNVSIADSVMKKFEKAYHDMNPPPTIELKAETIIDGEEKAEPNSRVSSEPVRRSA